MLGIIVWSVFCLGFGLALGSESRKVGERSPLISGLAAGLILWSAGVSLWWVIHTLHEIIGA